MRLKILHVMASVIKTGSTNGGIINRMGLKSSNLHSHYGRTLLSRQMHNKQHIHHTIRISI